MTQSLEYSIVLPVYDEEENLIPLAEGIVSVMNAITDSYEVILVDDGSSDGSKKVLKELCDRYPSFRCLMFHQNCGQTAAFDAGFKNARGKVIISMDADLQYDPGDITVLLKKLDEFDAVCGYRLDRADTWVKRKSSIIANFVRNRLSNENIRDVGCSLKVFKKECLDGVKLFEGMHRFFPTLIKMEGYKVTEVPVKHFPRKHGHSKYTTLNRVFKSFRDLLAVRWMKRRYLNYKIVEQYNCDHKK